MYKPESVPKYETNKILWDFQTDLQIPDRRPEIALINKKK